MAKSLFPITIGLFLLLTVIKVQAEESVKLFIEPDQVKIGLFYGGQKIYCNAETPAGYDTVIKVSGKNQDLELKKKGKKGGVLWMNVGELSYKAVPSLLLIKSSRPLINVSSKKVLGQLGIGYEALGAKVSSGPDDEARSLFGELVKLKRKEGLFSVDENGIEVRPLGSGTQKVSATFFLPPKAPPGEYKVEVFGFRDGKNLLKGAGSIKLDFARTMAFISMMAKNHGLLYGCLAVIIAITAGLITGFVFGGKSGSH